MRKVHEPGVAPSGTSACEVAARDAFSNKHPPVTGLAAPRDLRKMEVPKWLLGAARQEPAH